MPAVPPRPLGKARLPGKSQPGWLLPGESQVPRFPGFVRASPPDFYQVKVRLPGMLGAHRTTNFYLGNARGKSVGEVVFDLADCVLPGITLVKVGLEGGSAAQTTANRLGKARGKPVRQLLLALADSFSPGKQLDFHQGKRCRRARTNLTLTW